MGKSFGFLAESALSCVAAGSVKAILIVSAHWETADGVEVTFKEGPEPQHLFYDYCGFPSEMYRLEYRPRGSPEISNEAVNLLRARGFRAKANPTRHLDHGVFVPLMLMQGLEKLPVVQVSLPQLSRDWEDNARTALEMGRALSPLRHKGVLLIGSGQSTSTHRARSDAEQFSKALVSLCTSLDLPQRAANLENWRRMLPRARDVHSREEHLLPLLVAAGAAENELGSVQGQDELWSGLLSLTHFRFGVQGASSLAQIAKTLSPRQEPGSPFSKVSFGLEPLDLTLDSPSQSQDFRSSPNSARGVADLRHAAASKTAWHRAGVTF